MKANYIKSRTEAIKIANQAAREQLEEIRAEAYQKAADDIVEQLTATHLYVLATEFGLGEKRLKRFLDVLNTLNGMMVDKDSFLGKSATPDDVRGYMEKRYHLDLTLKKVMIEREDSRKK